MKRGQSAYHLFTVFGTKPMITPMAPPTTTGSSTLYNWVSLLNILTRAVSITAAFPEAERDRIRERIGQVKAAEKARGRYLGGSVPFGYSSSRTRTEARRVSAPRSPRRVACRDRSHDGRMLGDPFPRLRP